MCAECLSARIGHHIRSIWFSADELLLGLYVSQILQSTDVAGQVAVRYAQHPLEGVEIGLPGSGQH